MYVHSSRINKLLEYMHSIGIATEQALELAKISLKEVVDPKKTFRFEQFHKVFAYAIEQSGDEFYGLHMGREPYIAGTLGMTAASCRNLKEAFIQGCRFFKVQGDFADIVFTEDRVYPKIEYH